MSDDEGGGGADDAAVRLAGARCATRWAGPQNSAPRAHLGANQPTIMLRRFTTCFWSNAVFAAFWPYA